MEDRSAIDSPAHWRNRAKEALRVVRRLDDAMAKTTLREIAAAYEKLASILEAQRGSRRAK